MLDYTRPANFPPGGFVTVPTAALTLPPNALKVLLLALNWPPARHRHFSQQAVVAACPELGRDAVRTAFDVLTAAGWMSRDRRGTRHIYRLHAWTGTAGKPAADRPLPDQPTVAASDDPTPITPNRNQPSPPAPQPGTRPARRKRQEEGEHDERERGTGDAGAAEAVSPSDPVDAWLAAFIAALPRQVRPGAVPDRLRAVARRWTSHDPDAVAAAVAATLPPHVWSPAGLLITKLDTGLNAAQVGAQVGAPRRPANSAPPPNRAAVDAAVAAELATRIRARMAAGGTRP